MKQTNPDVQGFGAFIWLDTDFNSFEIKVISVLHKMIKFVAAVVHILMLCWREFFFILFQIMVNVPMFCFVDQT